MSVLERNNVKVSGRGTQPMLFAHGFGCDQRMWRLVAPAFEDDYRVVLFDHVGAGRSDLRAYDRAKYGTLHGYAEDVLEICAALGSDRRRLRGSLGERHDRRARRRPGAGAVRPPRAGRTLSPLRQRRRLRRRVHPPRHRGPARLARQQPPRLVRRDGARRSWATPTGPSWPRS